MISKFSFLVFNIVFGYFIGYCQTEITYRIERKNNPDVSKEILQLLFGGEVSDITQSISWKPKPKELFAVNSIGVANTSVDSVIYFDAGGVNYALYILKSFMKDEEGNMLSSNADVPTLSLALFDIDGDSLNLLAFNKLVCQKGNMNMFPKLRVVALGVNFKALSIEEEELKDSDIFTTFYSLSPWELGKEILSLPTSKIQEYSENAVIQKATFEIEKPKNVETEYFDIIVYYQLVRQKELGETILKKWNSTYQYDGRRWEKI